MAFLMEKILTGGGGERGIFKGNQRDVVWIFKGGLETRAVIDLTESNFPAYLL